MHLWSDLTALLDRSRSRPSASCKYKREACFQVTSAMLSAPCHFANCSRLFTLVHENNQFVESDSDSLRAAHAKGGRIPPAALALAFYAQQHCNLNAQISIPLLLAVNRA